MENQTSAAVPALMKRAIFAEIAALQTDGNGVFDAQSWADFGALGSRLTKAGVAWKTCELGSNFTAFMEAAFRDEAERGEIVFASSKSGTNANRRVRLTKAPAKKAVAASSVPEKKSTVAVKTTIPASPASPGVPANAPQKLSDAEIEKRVLAAIRELQTDENGVRDASVWVRFANLGSRLKEKGVDGKTAGFSSFAKFFETRFAEKLEFDGDPNARRTRPQPASTAVVPVAQAPSTASTVATVAEKTPVAANALTVPKTASTAVVPVAKSVPTPQTSPKLSDAELEKRVLAALRALQKDDAGRRDPSAWVDFTVLGSRLKAVGVDCKAFGCASYAKLLEARFSKTLQFDKNEPTAWRVRPTLAPNKDDAELADWAVVAAERFDELAKLALPEKWRFDDAEPTPGEPRFPILESHIKYTFRQLAFERKVKIAPTEDVAAFNTGLFDRNFDPIFAFFRKNVGPEPPLWRLSSFAVVAQDADGKELVARFEPLPKRARFFERREDLVFDGDAAILCDVEHCLVENVARLPCEFLRRYCSPAFLTLEIDGETRTLDAVAARPEKDPARRRYFKALEKRLSGSSELFEMKLRFDAAVELAKKRVAANFRTAVPFFNPRKRNVCYFLPLTLTARREAPERADVALVVERFPETGVYQGHTVYTLETAYKNARLTARLGGENWLDG
ncbi:MAG: DUF3825 domain-containing protein [Thermoguttaceae bacterium]|nr:DUF3825 domain-containing protein [Thermoguttaceae bacterium]